MKEIKDYLHLYLGCELYGTYNDSSGSKGILTGVTNGGYECEIQFYLEDSINVEEDPEFNESKEVKLILRPLSDMTEEESKVSRRMHDDMATDDKLNGEIEAARTLYALSKGFDLFGLIDAGLAIDKTVIA